MIDTLPIVNLTLYCKNSSKGEYVKMMLNKGAEEIGYDLIIKHVDNTETFIKDSIDSIPAVKIGTEIRCIGSLDAATFADQINQWIQKKLNYRSFHRLIVPIDYSDQSEKAITYAGMICKNLKCYIQLTHVYHPNYIEAEHVAMINTVIEQREEDRLKEYCQNIRRKWALNNYNKNTLIENRFLLGFPADKLIGLSNDDRPSLIIMGTTGGTGLLKNVFGSVSTKVAKVAKCPVILVPPDVSVESIKKIAYCSNDVELDAELLDQLLEIARPFDAEIHVIHYSQGQDDQYLEFGFLDLLKGQYPKERIKYEFIQAEPTATAINSYGIHHNIDLIAVGRADRGLIGNIFHKSLTARMAVDAQLPLLFLHK